MTILIFLCLGVVKTSIAAHFECSVEASNSDTMRTLNDITTVYKKNHILRQLHKLISLGKYSINQKYEKLSTFKILKE